MCSISISLFSASLGFILTSSIIFLTIFTIRLHEGGVQTMSCARGRWMISASNLREQKVSSLTKKLASGVA
ncbi:unnamed protein product [Calypogeia fissa]